MRFLLLFLVLINLSVSAKTLVLDANNAELNLKQAISLAQDGDTIRLKAGIYKGSDIIVEKQIHIIGEEGAIIDGENKKGIFIFTADNFTLEGLTIKNVGKSYVNDYAAVLVRSSKYFKIENLNIENAFFGILIEKSKWGLISKNYVSGIPDEEANSGNGIHMWHCNNMRVENNSVKNMRDGIYFEFVNKSHVSHNLCSGNIRYGLHFMFSNNDEYYYNEFKNNGAGVAVMFSKFIEMHHNVFHFNWGMSSYGLLLKEIYDAKIEHNIFEQNTIGINIENCSRVSYSNNDFKRNGWAVKFSGGCYTNTFEFNNFLNNSFDLSYSSKLNDNKFEANYWSEYTGYDLDKDGIGDVPYRPVNLFSYVVNQTPETLVLLRSLFVDIINFSEKVSPVFTPDNLTDNKPLMKRIND